MEVNITEKNGISDLIQTAVPFKKMEDKKLGSFNVDGNVYILLTPCINLIRCDQNEIDTDSVAKIKSIHDDVTVTERTSMTNSDNNKKNEFELNCLKKRNNVLSQCINDNDNFDTNVKSVISIEESDKSLNTESVVSIEQPVKSLNIESVVSIEEPVKSLNIESVVSIEEPVKSLNIESVVSIEESVKSLNIESVVSIEEPVKSLNIESVVSIEEPVKSLNIESVVSIDESGKPLNIEPVVSIEESVKSLNIESVVSIEEPVTSSMSIDNEIIQECFEKIGTLTPDIHKCIETKSPVFDILDENFVVPLDEENDSSFCVDRGNGELDVDMTTVLEDFVSHCDNDIEFLEDHLTNSDTHVSSVECDGDNLVDVKQEVSIVDDNDFNPLYNDFQAISSLNINNTDHFEIDEFDVTKDFETSHSRNISNEILLSEIRPLCIILKRIDQCNGFKKFSSNEYKHKKHKSDKKFEESYERAEKVKKHELSEDKKHLREEYNKHILDKKREEYKMHKLGKLHEHKKYKQSNERKLDCGKTVSISNEKHVSHHIKTKHKNVIESYKTIASKDKYMNEYKENNNLKKNSNIENKIKHTTIPEDTANKTFSGKKCNIYNDHQSHEHKNSNKKINDIDTELTMNSNNEDISDVRKKEHIDTYVKYETGSISGTENSDNECKKDVNETKYFEDSTLTKHYDKLKIKERVHSNKQNKDLYHSKIKQSDTVASQHNSSKKAKIESTNFNDKTSKDRHSLKNKHLNTNSIKNEIYKKTKFDKSYNKHQTKDRILVTHSTGNNRSSLTADVESSEEETKEAKRSKYDSAWNKKIVKRINKKLDAEFGNINNSENKNNFSRNTVVANPIQSSSYISKHYQLKAPDYSPVIKTVGSILDNICFNFIKNNRCNIQNHHFLHEIPLQDLGKIRITTEDIITVRRWRRKFWFHSTVFAEVVKLFAMWKIETELEVMAEELMGYKVPGYMQRWLALFKDGYSKFNITPEKALQNLLSHFIQNNLPNAMLEAAIANTYRLYESQITKDIWVNIKVVVDRKIIFPYPLEIVIALIEQVKSLPQPVCENIIYICLIINSNVSLLIDISQHNFSLLRDFFTFINSFNPADFSNLQEVLKFKNAYTKNISQLKMGNMYIDEPDIDEKSETSGHNETDAKIGNESEKTSDQLDVNKDSKCDNEGLESEKNESYSVEIIPEDSDIPTEDCDILDDDCDFPTEDCDIPAEDCGSPARGYDSSAEDSDSPYSPSDFDTVFHSIIAKKSRKPKPKKSEFNKSIVRNISTSNVSNEVAISSECSDNNVVDKCISETESDEKRNNNIKNTSLGRISPLSMIKQQRIIIQKQRLSRKSVARTSQNETKITTNRVPGLITLSDNVSGDTKCDTIVCNANSAKIDENFEFDCDELIFNIQQGIVTDSNDIIETWSCNEHYKVKLAYVLYFHIVKLDSQQIVSYYEQLISWDVGGYNVDIYAIIGVNLLFYCIIHDDESLFESVFEAMIKNRLSFRKVPPLRYNSNIILKFLMLTCVMLMDNHMEEEIMYLLSSYELLTNSELYCSTINRSCPNMKLIVDFIKHFFEHLLRNGKSNVMYELVIEIYMNIEDFKHHINIAYYFQLALELLLFQHDHKRSLLLYQKCFSLVNSINIDTTTYRGLLLSAAKEYDICLARMIRNILHQHYNQFEEAPSSAVIIYTFYTIDEISCELDNLFIRITKEVNTEEQLHPFYTTIIIKQVRYPFRNACYLGAKSESIAETMRRVCYAIASLTPCIEVENGNETIIILDKVSLWKYVQAKYLTHFKNTREYLKNV